MVVKTRKFGTLSDGSKVTLYKVSNGKVSFVATNYGCVITSLLVPSRSGTADDIVLAPPTLDSLILSDASFGGIVGRFANRIGNARFTLNGQEYQLDKNDGENCLHGGFLRWDKQVWDEAEIVEFRDGAGVIFSRTSYAGEQGMAGNLRVSVRYFLDKKNNLEIGYSALCDEDTILNLTNHSYFNLAGHNKGSIDSHLLTLHCSQYLEAENCIPTGNILPVENTVFDFTTEKPLGQDINADVLRDTRGYDHCYCIDHSQNKLVSFAQVREPVSGRMMTVTTDMPGVQLYTANWLKGDLGKAGKNYQPRDGFCLETQMYPDSPNKPNFPSCVLKAGEVFNSTTIYSFQW
ncbi:MAG: aldose epimerase family protein [Treponema sp.]|nr:aldose epimerase family protein [Treponema sp.]